MTDQPLAPLPRCQAQSKQKHQQCGQYAAPGFTVCKWHGAGTQQARKGAQERVRAAEATAQLQRTLRDAYGDNVPHIDPAEAMLQAVSWKYAEVLALRTRVAQLDDQERVWGVTSKIRKKASEFPGTDTTRETAPNIWWTMLRTAEDQLVKYAAAARAAGCDERRVRLAESQGALVAGVIRAILARLALTEQQQLLIPVVVPEELRRLAIEGAPA